MAGPRPETDGPRPDPSLTPGQVVRAQLDALRRNDHPGPDAGIASAFRFASEANRAVTGPVERFARMLRNPTYGPMIDHNSAELGPVRTEGDVARVQAVLFGAKGEVVAYDFTLSRDRSTGCWATDSVVPSAAELA